MTPRGTKTSTRWSAGWRARSCSTHLGGGGRSWRARRGYSLWPCSSGGPGSEDDNNDGADSLPDRLTECPVPDASWAPIEVRDGATGVQLMDTHSFAYTVKEAEYRVEQPGQNLIVLRAELENRTVPVADTHDDDTGFSHTMFDRLLVDGLSVGNPYCFVVVVGDEFQIEPGQRAVALVGYLTTEDVAGAKLVVETDGDQEIEITPSG